MPLRDHFRSPVNDLHSWDELHGVWPTFIVMALKPRLPRGYIATARVHLASPEVDVASYESLSLSHAQYSNDETGEATTAIWTPPKPSVDVIADPPDQDEYEVRVYDREHDRRLVAAVEIIGPSNKDRPAKRRAFIAKCAALLQDCVSVAIVDVVTIRHANLYRELLEFVRQDDTTLGTRPPSTYAAVCRWTQKKGKMRFE